jgi:hypothetical protein
MRSGCASCGRLAIQSHSFLWGGPPVRSRRPRRLPQRLLFPKSRTGGQRRQKSDIGSAIGLGLGLPERRGYPPAYRCKITRRLPAGFCTTRQSQVLGFNALRDDHPRDSPLESSRPGRAPISPSARPFSDVAKSFLDLERRANPNSSFAVPTPVRQSRRSGFNFPEAACDLVDLTDLPVGKREPLHNANTVRLPRRFEDAGFPQKNGCAITLTDDAFNLRSLVIHGGEVFPGCLNHRLAPPPVSIHRAKPANVEFNILGHRIPHCFEIPLNNGGINPQKHGRKVARIFDCGGTNRSK